MNPRPKPQPKPKPKPANLMEEVISIKHDESVVENPCLDTVAGEWAARLDVSPMAASHMIVAFLQLPARPYKPQERPPPERVSLAEEALSSDPMQAWFESRDVFACSRKVAQKRKGRQWPIFKTPFGADSHSSGVQVREAAARALAETSVASARRVHGLDEELPGEVGYNQQRLRSPRAKVGPESSTSEGGYDPRQARDSELVCLAHQPKFQDSSPKISRLHTENFGHYCLLPKQLRSTTACIQTAPEHDSALPNSSPVLRAQEDCFRSSASLRTLRPPSKLTGLRSTEF